MAMLYTHEYDKPSVRVSKVMQKVPKFSFFVPSPPIYSNMSRERLFKGFFEVDLSNAQFAKSARCRQSNPNSSKVQFY